MTIDALSEPAVRCRRLLPTTVPSRRRDTFRPNARRDAAEALSAWRLECAIGVVYRPETERLSHYFRASLPRQFGAVIHLDERAVVEPIDPPAVDEQVGKEPPETFPSGRVARSRGRHV